MNTPPAVAYSGILQDFVEPLCHDKETEASFLKKFIVHIQRKNRPGGATSYVESMPPDKMRDVLAKVNAAGKP
jgi:hypothetical protein